MKTSNILKLLVFGVICLSTAFGEEITLQLTPTNTGFYWYERWQWMGGNDTQTGFSYGETGSGMIFAQNNYQYYGGADRYYQRRDLYMQISLQDLNKDNLEAMSLWLYVDTNESSSASSLKHVSIQTVLATGDSEQQLAGTAIVESTANLVKGWNEIDITSLVLSDLENGYSYSAFSIPQFAQSQDENRLLAIYGASTEETLGGKSLRPYTVAVVPEPTTWLLAMGGGILLGGASLIRSRKR